MFVSEASKSLSLGTTINVSHCSSSLDTPSSACFILWEPSKENGLVTTPTVSAPESLATLATTGAPPVPVPPPIPAAIKTISWFWTSSKIWSLSSSWQSLPFSGFPPTPIPRASLSPTLSLLGTSEFERACASVLMVAYSIWEILFLYILLTALEPPPPTPTTATLAWPIFWSESCTKLFSFI